MAHALHRILLSSADTKKCLFAMVARNPQTDPKDGVYCHIFLLHSKEEVNSHTSVFNPLTLLSWCVFNSSISLSQANELSQLVGKAFKTAFACNSFKRENKKPPSILDSMPPHLPSAGPRPWTATTPPGHAPPLEPNSRPPPVAPGFAPTPAVPTGTNR